MTSSLSIGRRRLLAAAASKLSKSGSSKEGGGSGDLNSGLTVQREKKCAVKARQHQHHRRHPSDANKRMTEKKKVSKVDAVDVARPILSALSKKMHINKDTYKDVLRATVRCLFLYSSFCSFIFYFFLKLEWMLDDLGRELSA